MNMRVAVAMMSHETNTFSPVVTDLARFSGTGTVPPEGQEAYRIFRGTASCLGGFIEVCESVGAEVFIPIAAGAAPSGPVERGAYEYMCERIVAAARDCDAMLLDLHGAMVTQDFDDGEGELLTRIRRVAPDLPIAVSLDMHANVTEAMVRQANVICGYHTYPHVDMDRTAARAARVLFDALAGRVKPVMVWGHAPMLPHVMRQGTDDLPNQALQQRVMNMEADGALAVSLFVGFPHADIHDAGLSVVAVTDGDAGRAAALRDELLDQAWDDRASFVYEVEPLADSIDRAKALAEGPGEGPVVLLDHYDNTASGGTMDTTEVLAAVLQAGSRRRGVLCDLRPRGRGDHDGCRGRQHRHREPGRQTAHAGAGAAEPADRGYRAGAAAVRRPVSGDGRDVARAHHEHGPLRRAARGRARHRGDLAAPGTLRSGLFPLAGYRADRAALPDSEESHSLPGRLPRPGPRHGGVRRARCVYVGLFRAHVPQGAAADLSAGRDQRTEVGVVGRRVQLAQGGRPNVSEQESAGRVSVVLQRCYEPLRIEIFLSKSIDKGAVIGFLL
jgi:hypothetical protein